MSILQQLDENKNIQISEISTFCPLSVMFIPETVRYRANSYKVQILNLLF